MNFTEILISIWIRIGSGFNGESRRAKMTHKNKIKFNKNSIFFSAVLMFSFEG
jgi:hypothetical protein